MVAHSTVVFQSMQLTISAHMYMDHHMQYIRWTSHAIGFGHADITEGY